MRRYACYAIGLGLFGLLFFWSAIHTTHLIDSAFETHFLLGWATLSVSVLSVSGLIVLCVHEIRGYYSIRSIERLSSALQSDDIVRAKRECDRWLRGVCEDESVHLEGVTSVVEIRERITPTIKQIDAKVDVLIAKESLMSGAVVGISPWPIVDGLFVGWRQCRLLKEIASMYGARPRMLGTWYLLRRVLISVAIADASEHVTQWIASKVPSFGGLLPAAGQATAIVVLTVRLGRTCKTSCRPLQPQQQSCRTSFRSTCRRMLNLFKEKTTAKEKRTRCSFIIPSLETQKYFPQNHPRDLERKFP